MGKIAYILLGAILVIAIIAGVAYFKIFKSSATTAFLNIESGTVDIGLAHIEYTLGRFPVTEACDLPLGYPTGWISNQIVNDFYYKFKPKEWDKVKVLWLHANSPSVLITKKPVRKMEDLKGMTIRAPGRIGEVIAALGGTPAPTPVVETYDAIAKALGCSEITVRIQVSRGRARLSRWLSHLRPGSPKEESR